MKCQSIPAAAIALAYLAGCGAMSPAELRAQGNRLDFQSAKAPADMARCLVTFMDEYRPFLDARLDPQLLPGNQPGHFELRGGATAAPVIIADISPQGTGSSVTMYEGPYLAFRNTMPLMAKACR
jgi:hypothetical protein